MKSFVIIFIVVACTGLLVSYLVSKGHTSSEDELKVFKSFVEKRMKDGCVLDKYSNLIRNIEVLDKISGSSNMSTSKSDLNVLYNKSECIIRLTDDKMTFEIR